MERFMEDGVRKAWAQPLLTELDVSATLSGNPQAQGETSSRNCNSAGYNPAVCATS